MIGTYLDTGKAEQCCGCGACADICPCLAIVMTEGNDRSNYPKIIADKCIGCQKCRKVCPMLSVSDNRDKPGGKKAYAALLKDESEREKSASGGAFEGIASALYIKYPDLYIAGAAWQNCTNAVHMLLPANERAVFKKSKYVQSDCTGIYKKVHEVLECGKHVLFTGTPCQVSALKSYLVKDYDSLYTTDIICHGVPGGGIFKKFINELESKYKQKIAYVEFRHKKKDLFGEIHSDYLKITFDNGRVILGNKKTDPYLRGFYPGLFCRESCYSCPFANPTRPGDITLGDYWSVQKLYPDLVDYTGISCIIANSAKGKSLIDLLDMKIRETDIDFLINHNSQLKNPSKLNKNRNSFFDDFDDLSFNRLIDKYSGKAKHIRNIISGFIPGKIKRKLKNRKRPL